MYVSQETATKMRAVVALIQAEPRRLAMNTWANNVLPSDINAPPCGTVACFAGWTVINNTPKETLDNRVKEDNIQTYLERINGFEGIEKQAADILKFESHDCNRLFYVDNWPVKYSIAYADAGSKKEKAAILSHRVEHFIQTGE